MDSNTASRKLPSTRWTSFHDWDYNGMKERLGNALAEINKGALVQHAEQVMGRKLTISEPFSAGQYWICFELVTEDQTPFIARVRLPRHPDLPSSITEADELYSIRCEVTTMRYLHERFPGTTVPAVYAYEGPGSEGAKAVGAIFMLLEGFCGNTLEDVAPDLCSLPPSKQEHVMSQWANAQTQLATLSFPQIGSICSIAESGEPAIGALAMAASEGLEMNEPASSAREYFMALGNASIRKTVSGEEGSSGSDKLGGLVFVDIVRKTDLFHEAQVKYPFNHMDMGAQNILVDDDLNFLAIIDWEFAQSAPWQVNHYPMPFPLLSTDEDMQKILDDPGHIAHDNLSQQMFSQKLYQKMFREAEAAREVEGRPLAGSFAETLGSPASRIYNYFSRLSGFPEEDEDDIREMVRLAFGLDTEETNRYLKDIRTQTEKAESQ